MNDNIFLDKFKGKPVAELQQIVTDAETYIEEARLAAIRLLKEQGYTTPEFVTLETELEQELQKKKVIAEIEEVVRKENSAPVSEQAPELYSKGTIIAFCIVFSTLFAGVLLMYNMKRTNNTQGRIRVLIFSIFYTLLVGAVVNGFGLGMLPVLLLNITLNILGGIILNEFFWNKYIGANFNYRYKSSGKAFLIAFIIGISLIMLLSLLPLPV